MTIQPTNIPELRAESLLHQDANGEFMMGMWRRALRAHNPQLASEEESEVVRMRWRYEIQTLGSADMFYVTHAMTELARAASRSLPTFAVQPEDLPSRSGLTVFERPLKDGIRYLDGPSFPVRGILWSVFDGSVGCTPYLYASDLQELVPDSPLASLRQGPRLMCMANHMFGTPIGMDRELPDWEADSLFPLLLSTWLLMRQSLSQVLDVALDRAARKRARRVGQEVKPVRVIELRRPQSADAQAAGESSYHHQWIVRGHWRQHWYPKRQVHRPVWIAPHIKGPEGAPLIGGEKVYALKR